MIHQIETLRIFIDKQGTPGGIAYNGHIVHFWKNNHLTLCGKSNLVRRNNRGWLWDTASICKKCMAEIERQFVASLAPSKQNDHQSE